MNDRPPDDAPEEGVLTLRLDLSLGVPSDAEVSAQVRRCAHDGIGFFTLASVGDSNDTRSRLYELVREGVVDDPSNDGTFIGFTEFSERLFELYYWRWAEGQFLAALGGEWVGLTNPQILDDGALFGVTVVKRAHRGKGVARALKLLALRYLRDAGVTTVVTRNSARNEAVLRLNRGLGFRLDQ